MPDPTEEELRKVFNESAGIKAPEAPAMPTPTTAGEAYATGEPPPAVAPAPEPLPEPDAVEEDAAEPETPPA